MELTTQRLILGDWCISYVTRQYCRLSMMQHCILFDITSVEVTIATISVIQLFIQLLVWIQELYCRLKGQLRQILVLIHSSKSCFHLLNDVIEINIRIKLHQIPLAPSKSNHKNLVSKFSSAGGAKYNRK